MNKKTDKKSKISRGMMVVMVIVAVLILIAIGYAISMKPGEATKIPENNTAVSETETSTETQQSEAAQKATEKVTETADISETESETAKAQLNEAAAVSINLNNQMQIVDIGSYTGTYVEDGTDEVVTGVLMMVVTNPTEDTIQYAEIDLELGEEDAHFELSTLPAGASVVVMETNRLEYSKEVDYASVTATASNVAISSEPLNLYEDQLKIQVLDGVINVTNISGADILNDISIYYKNSAADMYYGGITYRVTLKGGLKADEIKQITATHFSESGSKIMFVTFGA